MSVKILEASFGDENGEEVKMVDYNGEKIDGRVCKYDFVANPGKNFIIGRTKTANLAINQASVEDIELGISFKGGKFFIENVGDRKRLKKLTHKWEMQKDQVAIAAMGQVERVPNGTLFDMYETRFRVYYLNFDPTQIKYEPH
jgi:hypothetical protein